MRKRLASRIAALAAVYCVTFALLVIIQFSNKGNFSLSVGAMTIRGRSQDAKTGAIPGALKISDGMRVYFGGLEFTLNEDRGKGLTIATSRGSYAVNPDLFWTDGNSAHFELRDFSGEESSILTFASISTDRGHELLISAEFPEDGGITEISIPITPRRASIVREDTRLGINYSGARYLFGTDGNELENRKITLTRENSLVSYKTRARQTEFDPANYIITQAANFESAFVNWKEESYLKWAALPASLQNEYDVMGYITEAIARGNYQGAVNSISREFLSGAGNSFRVSPFTGETVNAHRTLVAAENAKLSAITSLIRENSEFILLEEHLIDYLFTRSQTALAYDAVDLISAITQDMVTIDLCPGLLEAEIDLKRWRPAAGNPIENLQSRILTAIAENLVRDEANDYTLASSSQGVSLEFSARLGKALMEWARLNQDADWSAIARSLVLSSLFSAGEGNGDLYNIVNEEDNYPKAVWLMDNGLWAWTAASSARAANIGVDINIAFTFPVNMSHYIIIRGVRPFTGIQIHDIDWRSDSQFERYDSSGWFYYPNEQTLIIKLKHDNAVENVRIIYRAPPPPPPEPEPEPEAEEEQ